VKEETTIESVREMFTAFLEQKKMRKTPERYAILEKIYFNDSHFDAETLFEDMQKEYRVSLATIYNTIDLLLDCSLIVKHPFVGKKAKYEKTFSKLVHHHLICTICGTVKEFSDKKMRNLIESKSFATFEPSHYSLYLYGVCAKCKGKKKN